MTVEELRHLLSQGRRLTDEPVLRGVERLCEEHLGRLGEPLVSDELPRCLHQVRLIRRELEAGGDGAAESARSALRVLKARTAFAAAPREGGARVGREYKELIDVCLTPLLADCTAGGAADLAVFLESVYSYCHFHHHLARARRRSELRKRRREEQAARGPGEPGRPPSADGGPGEGGPGQPGRGGRRRRRRDRGPGGPGGPVGAAPSEGAAPAESAATPTDSAPAPAQPAGEPAAPPAAPQN
jgi:hypothetical protein